MINFIESILAVSGIVNDDSENNNIRRQRHGDGVAVSGNSEYFQEESNLHSFKKISLLENQLKIVRDEVKDINVKLDLLNSHGFEFETKNKIVSPQTQDKKVKRPRPIERKTDKRWIKNVSEASMKRLMTSYIQENFGQLKNEIVNEIHQKLRKDLDRETNVRRKKRAIDTPDSGGFQNMGSADIRNTYDNDFHHVPGESPLDRQLKKLTKIIEAELNEYKINIDNEVSAVNNELPESIKSIVQADGSFGLSIEKIFDMLREEVSTSLQRQSRNVKLTLNKHLDSVETKMTQILTLMEGMKHTYDKKFNNLLPTAISNGNKRIEQIETDIATLESGISSLRDNVISDPNIQDQLQQIEDKLQEKIAKEVQPIRRSIHQLRERVQTNSRQHGVTETSLQNFKADMREKTHYLELDITKLGDEVKDMNQTVKANVKKSKSCEVEKAKLMDAVTFVDEIRLELPSIWSNITNIEEICRTNLKDAKLSINTIVADVDKLTQNQTEITSSVEDFKSSLVELSNRIERMKQVNIKLALEYDEWVEYNFKHTLGQSACLGGKKYIKKTNYNIGKYVGVLLCSRRKYKIYLSDNIGETFLDIGDSRNFGEDHCEFVGGTRSAKVVVGKSTNWFRRMKGILF